MGWLGLRLRVVGRIWSGVRVCANFQIFALKMLLHSAMGFSLRVSIGDVFRVLFHRVPRYDVIVSNDACL